MKPLLPTSQTSTPHHDCIIHKPRHLGHKAPESTSHRDWSNPPVIFSSATKEEGTYFNGSAAFKQKAIKAEMREKSLPHPQHSLACPLRCCGLNLSGPPAEPFGKDLMALIIAPAVTLKEEGTVGSWDGHSAGSTTVGIWS